MRGFKDMYLIVVMQGTFGILTCGSRVNLRNDFRAKPSSVFKGRRRPWQFGLPKIERRKKTSTVWRLIRGRWHLPPFPQRFPALLWLVNRDTPHQYPIIDNRRVEGHVTVGSPIDCTLWLGRAFFSDGLSLQNRSYGSFSSGKWIETVETHLWFLCEGC